MFDFSHFISDYYAIALAIAMLVALLFLSFYYGLFHLRVGIWGRKSDSEVNKDSLAKGRLPGVSVVLTAHNDAAWLKENLVYLLEQDYPDFEVVVVDYLSRDDTPYVLRLLKDYYPHLKIVPFKEDVNLFQGKKYPLSIGIKSAKNDILLLADPDCTPKNLNWLRGMVRGYENDKVKIVLGYCGLKSDNTLLGALQQYDNIAYSANYLGCTLIGHPYTGSGRNLSYSRDFFFEKGAFISHYSVAGGADDLFVYQNATKRNTRICINGDARITTEPQKTFALWHKERLDRVATRNWHSFRGRLAEDLPAIANLLFYTAGILLITGGCLPWYFVAPVALLKWIWQIISFSMLSRRFDAGLIYLFAPIFEIYFIIANTILILIPLRSNRKFDK